MSEDLKETLAKILKGLKSPEQDPSLQQDTNATLKPEVIWSATTSANNIKISPYTTIPFNAFEGVSEITKPYKLNKKDIIKLEQGELQGFLPSEMITYRKETSQTQIEFQFTKDIEPNLSLMNDAFVGTINMAIQQKRFNPTYTLGDKLKLLGYTDDQIQRGGKVFKDLENAELSLANGRYSYWNKKKGKESIKRLGSLYANLEMKGEGKGMTLTSLLNPELFKNMDILTGKIEGRYVKYPMSLLTDKRLTHDDKKFLKWLVSMQGFAKPSINADNLLANVLDLTKQYLKRKEYCLDKIARCLELARQYNYLTEINSRGQGNKGFIKLLEQYPLSQIRQQLEAELKTRKIQDKDLLGDVRLWLICFKSKDTKGKKAVSYVPSPSDEALAQKIVNWAYKNYGDKLQRSEDEALKQWQGVIRKLGAETVDKIFDPIGRHPEQYWGKTTTGKMTTPYAYLWQEIKKLKTEL